MRGKLIYFGILLFWDKFLEVIREVKGRFCLEFRFWIFEKVFFVRFVKLFLILVYGFVFYLIFFEFDFFCLFRGLGFLWECKLS